MNILYIHTHDTGRYIQPYGYNIPTPNLMRMAEEGVIFRQCFNAGPTCSPSRAAMLTGMNAHASGMLGLAHRGFSLRDPSQHLANYLKDNGYETVLGGIQHETTATDDNLRALGYDRLVCCPAFHPSDDESPQEALKRRVNQDIVNARATAAYLKQPKERPFFLSFGMFVTHRNFLPVSPDAINPNYVQPPQGLPDTATIRQDMAEFMNFAQIADQCVGIVFEALRESGREDETLVLFTTDHGIAFPAMKCHLYDSGIGVALLMKFPKQHYQGRCRYQGRGRYQGRAIDAMVSHLDVYPTLCDMAGLESPDWLEGHSMLPLLTGEAESIRDEIFSEVTYHAAYEPMRCIRTRRYKYIRYYDNDDGVVKPNIDNGYSKQFLLEHGLRDRPHDDGDMLFDLYFDPCEGRNLAADPAYTEIKQSLASRLRQWMQATDDPLLRGPVPKPAGARINTKTGLHPEDRDYEE